MLTAKAPCATKGSCDWDPRSMQTRTRGGSSETEVNELTVSPTGAPVASRAATTVTPVGYDAMTVRSTDRMSASGGGVGSSFPGCKSGHLVHGTARHPSTPAVRRLAHRGGRATLARARDRRVRNDPKA
jgi:hypothetical protein